MAIGLQKLSARSGYEYLTRQVAPGDVTSLADYYTAKGESPGRWWGAGLTGMGLVEGQPVTEEQMKRLFGAGLNPVTGEKLGRAYSVFTNPASPFETELDRRSVAWLQQHPAAARVPVRKACEPGVLLRLEEERPSLAGNPMFPARAGRSSSNRRRTPCSQSLRTETRAPSVCCWVAPGLPGCPLCAHPSFRRC